MPVVLRIAVTVALGGLIGVLLPSAAYLAVLLTIAIGNVNSSNFGGVVFLAVVLAVVLAILVVFFRAFQALWSSSGSRTYSQL
jgi:hypothetical protein